MYSDKLLLLYIHLLYSGAGEGFLERDEVVCVWRDHLTVSYQIVENGKFPVSLD